MSTVDDIMVLADRYAEENSPPLGEYLQRRDELRAALESFAAEREQAGRSEPEQGEPVAWIPKWAFDRLTGKLGAVADPITWGLNGPMYATRAMDSVPVYAAPPRRNPLTDETFEALWDQTATRDDRVLAFGRLVEHALGIGDE